MNDDKRPADEPLYHEEQGATEEQNEKIDAIVGDEVLGYEGPAHGEHSGQQPAPHEESLEDSLADNRPDQIT